MLGEPVKSACGFQVEYTDQNGGWHSARGTSQVERFFKSVRQEIVGKSVAPQTAHFALTTLVHRTNVCAFPPFVVLIPRLRCR